MLSSPARPAIATRAAPSRCQPPPSRSSHSRSTVGVLTVIILVGATLRLAGLGAQSYWFDEAHTVWITRLTLSHMLASIPSTESSPPLYFLVAWVWGHILGFGPIGLRSLSALAGIATIPGAYGVGRQFASERAALILAGLTACSPILIWYSQEARSYALMVLLTSLTLLYFGRLRAGGARRDKLGWAVVAGLSVTTHYFALLVVIPQWIWLAVHLRRDRGVRLALEGVLTVSSGILPVALIQLKEMGQPWMTVIPLAQRVGDVPRTFTIGPEAAAGTELAIIVAAASAVAVWFVVRRASRAEQRSAVLIGGLTAAGAATIGLALLAGSDVLDFRNLLPLWLPCALIVATGLGTRRAGVTGLLAACAIGATGIITATAVLTNPALQRPDWRGVASSVSNRPARAIFMVNGCETLPLSLYLPRLQNAPKAGVEVREVDVVRASGQTSLAHILDDSWYIQCAPTAPGSELPGRLGPFAPVDRVAHVHQFQIERLVAPRLEHLSAETFRSAGLSGELLVQPPG